MICVKCGGDIDAKGQDNVSTVPGRPLCEDCAYGDKDVYQSERD